MTIGAITGQAPEVYVREHVKNARVQSLPAVPPNSEMGKMLLDGKVDAFAANRTRMEELVRDVPDEGVTRSRQCCGRQGRAGAVTEEGGYFASIPAAGLANNLLYNAVSLGEHSISRISKFGACRRSRRINAVHGFV